MIKIYSKKCIKQTKFIFALLMIWQVLFQQNKIVPNNNKQDCYSVECVLQPKLLFPFKPFQVSKYLLVNLSF